MTDPTAKPLIAPVVKVRYQSLSRRLVVRTLAVGMVLLISVLGVNYYLSLRLLRQFVREVTQATALSAVDQIEQVFGSGMTSASSLALEVTEAGISPDQIKQTILTFLQTDPDIYGMTVALEPHALHPDLGRFSPYYRRHGSHFVYKDLAAADYDYLEWDWYTLPKAADGPLWTEPYYDEGGGCALMTTYSSPIRESGSVRFAGVATAGIALDWLHDLVEEIHVGESGIGFILSKEGRIVAHPDESKTIPGMSPSHPDAAGTPLLSAAEKEEAGFWRSQLATLASDESAYFDVPCPHRDGACWVAVHPLLDTGWRVLVVVPETELTSRIIRLTSEVSLIAIAGLIILVVVVTEMTRGLMSPLARLATATKDIGAGNLDVELPRAETRDGIGAMTTDFRVMRESLQSYIAELEETTAKRNRLEREIEIARDIQMSMVSGHGELCEQGARFEAFATLRPARTIGGDLYYVQEDEGKLHFVLGDVSDKGVPAALFMAKTVTLYTATLGTTLTPGETFKSMNDTLSQDNDGCTFVTALCGVLDLESGELVMANAGHMNPVTRSPSACGELGIESEMALGITGALEYPNVRCVLEPGTSLIMYTDGISEAFNHAGEEYGLERILAIAGGLPEPSAEHLGRVLLADVDRFADTAEQFDDITLLVIHYAG